MCHENIDIALNNKTARHVRPLRSSVCREVCQAVSRQKLVQGLLLDSTMNLIIWQIFAESHDIAMIVALAYVKQEHGNSFYLTCYT